MRDLIRLVLTLLIVTALAAALLAGANALTAPVIAQRQEEDYRSALKEYFPGMEDFKNEVLEQDSFDLVYDAAGEFLGVMASTGVQGYDGLISYNLAVDSEGKILGIRIVEHTETKGVGDVIEKPEFHRQFLGKSFLDPLQPGEDVDTVSGATKSTAPMIDSIRTVLGIIADNYLTIEKEESLDIGSVPDGVYRGSGRGLFGDIVVEINLAGGRITAIEIVEHSETPTYLAEAASLVPPQIIDEQALEVDTKSGATGSCDGIVEAVLDALTRALNPEGGESGEE